MRPSHRPPVGGVDPGGVDPGGVEPGGVEPGGVEPGGVEPGGAVANIAKGGSLKVDLRSKAATWAVLRTGALSKALRLGGGSVIGGRVGLTVAPDLLETLAAGKAIALVSGTNGKTTTTCLLAAALGGPSQVASSGAGANLPPGIVSALAHGSSLLKAVIEVDEGYLPRVAKAVSPHVVCLLNLSRDQLDRMSEVRMVAKRWREMSATLDCTVVANADDPLVVWAAEPARDVRWVAVGQLWQSDSTSCPACGGKIEHHGPGWACTTCPLRCPEAWAKLDGDTLRIGDLSRTLSLSLPGRCNEANAVVAAVAALEMERAADGPHPSREGSALGSGWEDRLDRYLEGIGGVSDVEGRFATLDFGSVTARLLLAKNPAGWTEMLSMVEGGTRPVVIGLNAKVADGHDPSWIWDVELERLVGRRVVATGERARDLAVRLRCAGVDWTMVSDQVNALATAGSSEVDYIGNYTAFQELRSRSRTSASTLGRSRGPMTSSRRPHLHKRPAADPVSPDPAPPTPAPPTPPAIPGTGGVSPISLAPVIALRNSNSLLQVVVVLPDLLGTYGDGGNGMILAARGQWHGLETRLVWARSSDPIPEDGDIYCLGGGEDGPQALACDLLRGGSLERALDRGAALLAICAGFQIIGRSFPAADGSAIDGLGLLDMTTRKGSGRRAVGDIVVDTVCGEATAGSAPGVVSQRLVDDRVLGDLSGFENHGGVTALGPGLRPLGRVVRGVGNGDGSGLEGARNGRIVGTYLHGPLLARNPRLADSLLSLVTGVEMNALDDGAELALRHERFESVLRASHGTRRLPPLWDQLRRSHFRA